MLVRMKTLDRAHLDAAERFLMTHGRLLERLRFAQLFRAGASARVLAALAPYQNSDGGFGQALEPDYRGPVSQPLCTDLALRILDEQGSPSAPWLGAALDQLVRVRAADGGVPNVLASASAFPRAPWWQPDPAQPGCLLPTASIAGWLHKQRSEHAFVAPATAFSFLAIENIPARVAARTTPLELIQIVYEARAALVFLEHVPDRARATRAASTLRTALDDAGVLAREPGDCAEAAAPLDFAPAPSSVARGWFDDALIARHLDALIAEQADDGGFLITWPAWSPLAAMEWRALQTIERLKTLRAYGRLEPACGAP
jgi:hypothetical protein